jgi:SAM-dependent methyltransferase
MILVVLCVIVFLFGFVLLYGAPYLPTMKKQINEVLDLLELKPGDTLLELGCGDGAVLLVAARRGIKSVGIELNPILFLVASMRTFRYRELASVQLGNYWNMKWPAVDGIYVFLLDSFMSRLHTKLVDYSTDNSTLVVSYTFQITEKKPKTVKNGMFLYSYGARSERRTTNDE